MRVTSCPDCGEAVELPLSRDDNEVEVTCPTCGLSGPVEEWWQFEPENNETLLGRPLGAATIPESVPKRWALRVEQLEEIREVVYELQHQIRLLRQALDELNEDLPERVKRWFDSWHAEYLPSEPQQPESAPGPAAREPLESPPLPSNAKVRGQKRSAAGFSKNQSGLW